MCKSGYLSLYSLTIGDCTQSYWCFVDLRMVLSPLKMKYEAILRNPNGLSRLKKYFFSFFSIKAQLFCFLKLVLIMCSPGARVHESKMEKAKTRYSKSRNQESTNKANEKG